MFIAFLFAMYQVVQEDTRSLGGWGGSLSCRLIADKVTNFLLQPLTKKHSLEIKSNASAPEKSFMTL